VSDLVGTVDKRLRSVLSEDMSRDLGRFVHSLANVTEGIERGHGLLHALIYEPRLAESATGFVDDAQKSAARLGETLRRIDAVMLAIEKGNGTLHSLVYGDDGAKLVAELSHTAADLGALVAEVRRGHGLLHSLVYEEGDRRGQNLLTDLSAAARIMRTLAEEAQQGKGTVGGLLRDPTIYEDLKLLLGKVTRNVLLKAAVRAVIRSEGLKREAEPKIE
jgi:phospholipid/cholesterol/gamma-HCH transport system substrate-binding protein